MGINCGAPGSLSGWIAVRVGSQEITKQTMLAKSGTADMIKKVDCNPYISRKMGKTNKPMGGANRPQRTDDAVGAGA